MIVNELDVFRMFFMCAEIIKFNPNENKNCAYIQTLFELSLVYSYKRFNWLVCVVGFMLTNNALCNAKNYIYFYFDVQKKQLTHL